MYKQEPEVQCVVCRSYFDSDNEGLRLEHVNVCEECVGHPDATTVEVLLGLLDATSAEVRRLQNKLSLARELKVKEPIE